MIAVVAATHHAPATALSPIRPEGSWLNAYRAAIVAGFLCYLATVAIARRHRVRLAPIVAAAIALQVLPLAAPLLFSTDAYGYWNYGRVAAVHGENPYTDPPLTNPDDPALAYMGADWHDTTAAYGPLWIATAEAYAGLAGDDPDRAADFFKALGAVGAVLLTVVVAALTRSTFAVAFVGLNPVMPLHSAGGGHNDALMMTFVVLGLLLPGLGRRQLGGAAWVVATFIKWFPAVLFPLIALRDRRQVGWVGVALAFAGLSVFATLLYGPEWLRATVPISDQLQRASSTSVPFQLEEHFGIPQRRATQALSLLFVAAYLLLLRQAARGRARCALTAGLFCAALSWLPAWYVVWPVSLAAVEEDRAGRAVALALSAWLLRDAIPLS